MPGKVLVVEDDPEVLAMILETLNDHGYATVSAENGERALAALAADRFDAVVSDLAMPTMNGLRLLEVIQDRRLAVPVIIVSGFVTHEVTEEALARGAHAVLDKPFRHEQLLDAIGHAIGGGRGSA